MSFGPAIRVACVALILSAFLAAMIARQQFTLSTGRAVVLETEPIDPHDLFRGDYVRLGFPIARIDPALIQGSADFAHGDTAYVTLRPGAPYWSVAAVSRDWPKVEGEEVVLAGEVDWGGASDGLHLSYGIESYYVPQGAGHAIEDAVRDKKVDMAVAIDRFGHAAIKALMVDGKPVYAESLF